MAKDRYQISPSSTGTSKYWTSHIKAYDNSGLSMAEYCRRQGLSYHAFRYWKKKQENSPSVPVVPFVEIGRIKPQSCTTKFCLKINLPGRYSIDVGDGFSSSTLARVISVLEEL